MFSMLFDSLIVRGWINSLRNSLTWIIPGIKIIISNPSLSFSQHNGRDQDPHITPQISDIFNCHLTSINVFALSHNSPNTYKLNDSISTWNWLLHWRRRPITILAIFVSVFLPVGLSFSLALFSFCVCFFLFTIVLMKMKSSSFTQFDLIWFHFILVVSFSFNLLIFNDVS